MYISILIVGILLGCTIALLLSIKFSSYLSNYTNIVNKQGIEIVDEFVLRRLKFFLRDNLSDIYANLDSESKDTEIIKLNSFRTNKSIKVGIITKIYAEMSKDMLTILSRYYKKDSKIFISYIDDMYDSFIRSFDILVKDITLEKSKQIQKGSIKDYTPNQCVKKALMFLNYQIMYETDKDLVWNKLIKDEEED